ncbi:MAG: archease [Betaproteobacteria bacterium]|nr:archease [Betaproteobacteria bacterium]
MPQPTTRVLNPESGGRYAYFEHDADIGIIGRGATLEEAFEGAARATFAIMTDIEKVRAAESVTIEFEEADDELALVRWLNLLLGSARERGLVFGRFWVERDGVRWRGGAGGEPWRPHLERGVEVKGATLTMLTVKPAGAGWEARCVVDV